MVLCLWDAVMALWNCCVLVGGISQVLFDEVGLVDWRYESLDCGVVLMVVLAVICGHKAWVSWWELMMDYHHQDHHHQSVV
jgi:hypothetical protein